MALALAPLFHVLGIGLLPDTLLMFFTLLRRDLVTIARSPALWLPVMFFVLAAALGFGLFALALVAAALALAGGR